MDSLDEYLPQTKDNLAKLIIAVSQDVRVIIIKLADRLHNLRTLKHTPPEKQVKVARESLDIFAPIADRIGMGQVRMEIEDIAFKHLDPKEYKKVQGMLKKRLGKSTKRLGAVRVELEKKLKEEGIKAEINGRIKTVYSLYRKLKKVNGDIDQIYDFMALRVIVGSKEDCYKVMGILHTMYEPELDRIKDYISQPKPNGYRSLHTTIKTPKDNKIVEFQIRTQKMHEYAEQGLAASFHYNQQKDSKKYAKRKDDSGVPKQLEWITELQKVAVRLGNDQAKPNEHLYLDLFEDTIFVYSPRGDIFSLPQGALPLDFAFLIHSDVAKRAHSFKVNDNIRAFNKPLENGDIVEVVTRENASPKKAWEALVTTHHARNKLRQQLRQMGIIETIGSAAAIIRRKALRQKSK
jgi:GTP pyrophosphokinase